MKETLQKDEAQEKAVQFTEGQLLLTACPGSGKTTTLLRRIHYLIKEKHVISSSILMVTYTKAAAEHMKKRYAELYGEESGVFFSTIHALCFRILRQYAGLRTDAVLQESEIRPVLYDLAKKDSSINDREEFIGDFLSDVTYLKSRRLKPEEIIPVSVKDKNQFLFYFNAYENYKKQNGKIDFDDMLLMTDDLFQRNPDILHTLQNQFRWIQVDEFQDINAIQKDIIYALAGKNGNLAVVGDDDQAIYGFRGAEPDIMLEFTKDYPKAVQINMTTNYRSESEVIKHASALICHNVTRFQKDFLGKRKETGNVKVHGFQTRQKEIEFLSDQVHQLMETAAPEEIAVLYRKNSLANGIAEEFLNRGIPFSCRERMASRYAHWIYRDVLTYHRLANGTGDEEDLQHIANRPQRFLSKRCLSAYPDQKRMIAILRSENKEEWQIESSIDNLNDFFSLLKQLKHAGPKETMELLEYPGDYTGYLTAYAEYRNHDDQEYLSIFESLKEDAGKVKTFKEWADYAESYSDEMAKASKRNDGITLSTMHGAKGLEWKYVFITDANEGITPDARAVEDRAKEEERRLFYVALTRAKDDLYILYSDRPEGRKAPPSSFLAEIQTTLREQKELETKQLKTNLISKIQSDPDYTAEEKQMILSALQKEKERKQRKKKHR